ncbi:uncharacterized protein LOC100893817 [Strongylocentrotus purpuratus]|uniref:Major facilitator superfamily (MFS) profile domain-containing protein n=1 Tax=Strongylocentrotus purpuratus TaxID=7668 RepID=A0A7M7T4M0_STRPU|nr:uncharacterized protein LOC100893817 [Strongylocentrotus purpuratus]
MGDETDFLWLEYSQESPFVRAFLEEELEREAEEREEEEGEPAEQIRVYEFDEQSISLGWRIYALAIVTFLNVLNFTQQYLLIVTIFGMANELEFGETQCQVINETLARDYLHDHNMTGDLDGLCSEIGRCAENSTLFLPDVCGIQYTGQGILFEILAGPIYLIVQGVTSIPLVGLIQRLSLRPPFVIGLFTILWTLCTFITAYVNDYWAIALLRFLFGVFSCPHMPVAYAYLASVFPSKVHTLVFGVAHYGCIAGYGIAYFFVFVSDGIGWRWCYYICGAMGVVVAIGSCFMANPKVFHCRGQSRTFRPSWKQQRAGLRQIVWSVMMPLILANTSRIAALNVGSYNITLYMTEYFPDFNVAFLGWVTLVSSFPGSIFGGLLCDILRRTSGIRGRLWLSLVLMVISLVVSPLISLTPVTMAVALFGIYIAASDWFYVVNLAVISDLTPLECKTTIFALNFFFTNSLGGAVNLTFAPIASLVGLRTALTSFSVLLCGISVVVFLIPIGVTECLGERFGVTRNEEENTTESGETTPLTASLPSYRSLST